MLTVIVSYTVVANGICPVLIFVFTVLMATELYQHHKQRRNMSGNAGNVAVKQLSVTMMLFIVATIFLLTRGSQVIVWHVRSYCSSHGLTHTGTFQNTVVMWPLLVLLGSVYHSCNFLIYLLFLQDFRRCFLGYVLRSRDAGPRDAAAGSGTTGSSRALSSEGSTAGQQPRHREGEPGSVEESGI